MPRLRPMPDKKEEPTKPVRQLILPDDETPELEAAPLDKEKKKAAAVEQEVVVEDDEQPDASLALKKQIEELKKSEEVQRSFVEQLRREREDALRIAAERTRELSRSQRDIVDQEDDTLQTAIGAAKTTAEKALSDFTAADAAGDAEAKATALDRLTNAKADLKQFERAREELKERRKELKKERKKLEAQQELQTRQPAATGDVIDSYNLPDDCKNWLRSHREYITDRAKAIELDFVHQRAGLKGLKPGDSGYLAEIDKGLAALRGGEQTEREIDDDEQNENQQQRSSIVSAPPSRETPAGDGQRQSTSQVRLTKEEKEIAKNLDLSEVDYAKQKQKLAQMRAAGTYGERQ